LTPTQLIDSARKGRIAPAYLFFGPEPWQRDECRRALLTALVGEGADAAQKDAALVHHDFEEETLVQIIDDARSMSLFAPSRLLWVSRAEGALPKGRALKAGEEGDASALHDYLRAPVPGVVAVFDSSRHEWEGEDKAKAERVRSFFAPIRDVVEFPRWTVPQTRTLAQGLAREAGLKIGAEEITYLVEAVGGSPSRVAIEMEKLRLFAGAGTTVTLDVIASMAPQAQATTIFKLVDALARNDRTKALDILGVLVREGEYLPIALQFLGTQFRQALAAQEAGLRSSQQVMSYFTRQGVHMWPSRAQQVVETAKAFSNRQLTQAISRIAAADRTLKDINPDDRLVMEEFVINLMR
jgi:DNA polymerase-3 subunit delta